MVKSLEEQERKIEKSFVEDNCQVDIWQQYCMDRTTRDLIESTGKETREDRMWNTNREKEPQRWLEKKTKKKKQKKKNQE